MRSQWEEFQATLGDVLHDGDDVVVVEERPRGRGRHSSGGRDVRLAVYWLAEDDRIRRRAAFTQPEAALEAAGLSAG